MVTYSLGSNTITGRTPGLSNNARLPFMPVSDSGMIGSMVTYCGVGVAVGTTVGRVVFGLIVADAAIVPFFAATSPPVVFPTGNAGAFVIDRIMLPNIITNNTKAPAVMEKYCLYFCSFECTWGMKSVKGESWTSLRERLSTFTRNLFS